MAVTGRLCLILPLHIHTCILLTALCAFSIPSELGHYEISPYTAGYGQCFFFFFFSFITSRCIRAFCNCNLPEWWYFIVHSAALMHRPAAWVNASRAALTFKLFQTFADWNCTLRASSLWGMPHSAPVKNVNRSRKSNVIICGCSFLLCVLLLSRCGTSARTEFPYFPPVP